MTYLFDRLAEQAKIDAKEEAGRQRDNAKYAKETEQILNATEYISKGEFVAKFKGMGLNPENTGLRVVYKDGFKYMCKMHDKKDKYSKISISNEETGEKFKIYKIAETD